MKVSRLIINSFVFVLCGCSTYNPLEGHTSPRVSEKGPVVLKIEKQDNKRPRSTKKTVILSPTFALKPNIKPLDDIASQDNDGLTPLHHAVIEGNIYDITFLLKQPNIDVNCYDNDGLTPLHYAVDSEKPEIVKLLLKQPNINVNCQDNDGLTPLHCAVDNNDLEVVQLLLNYPNINVNLQDNDGFTPLHYAVMQVNFEITYAFLEKGARFDIIAENGLTAFDIAEFRNQNLIELFKFYKK